MVSKIKDIAKKLPAVRSATKADIAKKLAEGLPIAGMENGRIVVQQLVEVEALHLVAKPVAASSMNVMTVKPKAGGNGRTGALGSERKGQRKSASAA